MAIFNSSQMRMLFRAAYSWVLSREPWINTTVSSGAATAIAATVIKSQPNSL
jgi:hypothetical protein